MKIIDNNKHTTEVFEKMPVPKALFTMIVPTVMAQLIVLLYSLADTYFIGKTNNPNMVAAVSLLLPIYNLTLPLANMTGVGGGTLISRLLARNEEKEAKKVCAISFYICLIIAFFYAMIFLLFLEPILHGLGANDEIYEYAKIYTLLVIVLGAIPTGLSNSMASLIRCCGFSKEAGFGITLGGVINIFLDPLFMFVLFPKGQEVAGAASATLLSNIITLIYFMIVSKNIKNKSSINYDLRIGLPKKTSIVELFSIGIPVSINSFLFDIDYIILDKLMAGYGAVSLAALGITLKAERLPLNTGVGICQAMVPIVAYNNSAKKYKRMNDIIKLALLTGICVCAVSLLLYQIFTPEIMRIFINENETVKAGTVFLRYRSLATTFMFLSFFFNYLFQSFGKGVYSLRFVLLRWIILNIPLLFILNAMIGINGLVMAQAIADIISSAVTIFAYFRFVKKNKYI